MLSIIYLLHLNTLPCLDPLKVVYSKNILKSLKYKIQNPSQQQKALGMANSYQKSHWVSSVLTSFRKGSSDGVRWASRSREFHNCAGATTGKAFQVSTSQISWAGRTTRSISPADHSARVGRYRCRWSAPKLMVMVIMIAFSQLSNVQRQTKPKSNCPAFVALR